MSYQTQPRSTPHASADPLRREISRALTSATSNTDSPKAARKLAVPNHLDAVYHAIQSAPELDQAIRLPTVLAIVGMSKSSWYARLSRRSPAYDPRVPQPFKLGTSRNSPSVWWRSAVMAYLNACANAQVQA